MKCSEAKSFLRKIEEKKREAGKKNLALKMPWSEAQKRSRRKQKSEKELLTRSATTVSTSPGRNPGCVSGFDETLRVLVLLWNTIRALMGHTRSLWHEFKMRFIVVSKLGNRFATSTRVWLRVYGNMAEPGTYVALWTRHTSTVRAIRMKSWLRF